jgi:tetratricopeptide (TPR) repeat protein
VVPGRKFIRKFAIIAITGTGLAISDSLDFYPNPSRRRSHSMRMPKSPVSLLPLILALVVSRSLLFSQATVTESKQVFRTYPFGDPDPVARFTNIYPYFRFEKYNIVPKDREWNIVTLENQYIRVLIAPEIGGKILGAIEKSTGKAFIYFNRVVKFREIAMRGPWTSGGIEFNFGDIGHTPATATPVDYLTRTNADGSVSCIVGTIDLASRTEWRVDIRLPKDKAYFQTESYWYNPTDLNTSLYHWMNAAADASEDLQLKYPGTGYIDHGGGAFSWPLDNSGRDLSRYANNAFGPAKSYHVLGSYTDTYAAYYAGSDFGVVHWSPFTDKPGKKIWIWARSREGEIWTDLLTDTDLGNRQYVEIQSGLLFNQAAGNSTVTPFKHQFFAPVSEESFVEAWYPFKNIGGLVESNLSGTLNVQTAGKMLRFGFCPLGKTAAPLIVSRGGKEIYKKDLVLQPLQEFVDSVVAGGSGEIEVKVGDLITFRSGEAEAKKLHRPMAANREYDWTSVEGLYTEGAERAKQRDYKGALEKYLSCLSKDPVHTQALTGAAEMYYRRMEYDKAIEYAKRALANDAYDPDANILYGVISRKLGNLYDALDGFGVAARAMKYRSAANVEMAEIAFLQQRWPAAEAYAFRGLDYDRMNARASRFLPVLYRFQGTDEGVRNAIQHLREIDPLSHLASFEDYLRDTSSQKLAHFKSIFRSELPQENYLELASYYAGLRLFSDATKVLEQGPTHPIISYWLAWLNHELKNEAKADAYLKEALELSPALVFPFRQETAEVLKWAEGKRPHWKTKYYLALVYLSKDRPESAGEILNSCGSEPNFAPFYLVKGNLLRSKKSADALKEYKRALELGKDEWRTYRTLMDYDVERLEYAEALSTAKAAAGRFPASYVALFDYARALILNNQPAASLAILDTLTVLPFEGARYTREVFRQACVLAGAESMKRGNYQDALRLFAKARNWPERLGVGKPYDVDTRFEDYLESLCAIKLGDKARGRRIHEQIVAYTRTHDGDMSVNRLFGALAGKTLGQEQWAASLIDQWTSIGKSSSARWLVATFKREGAIAAASEKDLRGSSDVSLLGRGTIDPDLALVIEVSHTIQY